MHVILDPQRAALADAKRPSSKQRKQANRACRDANDRRQGESLSTFEFKLNSSSLPKSTTKFQYILYGLY